MDNVTGNCTSTKADITVKTVFDGTKSGQQAFIVLIKHNIWILISQYYNSFTTAAYGLPYMADFQRTITNICYLLKDKGDIEFITDTLKENQIRTYWERKWYRESFYLLAMVDYLSRENDLPLFNNYEDIRNCKLSEPLYPRDVILAAKLDASFDVKEQYLKDAIPEFMRFNIIESEIRNGGDAR